MANNVKGTVYLLHFHPRFQHAGHYLGWTGNSHGDARSRFEYHLRGQGSPLVKAAVQAGCEISISRTWMDVTRNFERRMKTHSATRLCPVCSGPGAFNRGRPR